MKKKYIYIPKSKKERGNIMYARRTRNKEEEEKEKEKEMEVG